MLVKIKNFRCHRDLELNITSNIVQIGGDSGVGKTTIYEAIKWCIHGPKITVTPNGCERVRTEVSLIYSQFLITRTNNPRVLIYQDAEGQLTSHEAQAKINQLFGVYPLWVVEQRKDHLLMNPPEAQRHDAIMNLLFPSNNHLTYVDNVKLNYKRTLIELENSKIRCQELMNLINNEVRINSLTQQHFDTIPRLQDLQDKLTLMNGQIEAGIAHNAALNQFNNRKSSLCSKLKDHRSKEEYELAIDNTETQLESSPLDRLKEKKIQLQDFINGHSKMMMQLTRVTDLIARLDGINRQVNQLKAGVDRAMVNQQSITCKHKELTAKEFQELVGRTQSQLNIRSIHLSKAARLGIPYTVEARDAEVNKLNEMIIPDIAEVRIQHQKLVQLLEAKIKVEQALPQRKQSLKMNQDLLVTIEKENETISNSIVKLESELLEIGAGNDKLLTSYQLALITESCRKLTCPHCQNECGLIDSKLIKMEDIPEITTTSASIMNSINLLNQRSSSIRSDMSQLRTRFNSNNMKIGNYKSTITNLQSQVEQLIKTSSEIVSSEAITSLTHKIKNHDYAIGRIHEARMIEIIEAEDLTNDKEWWRLEESIQRDRDSYNNQLSIQAEVRSQLDVQQLDLAQYNHLKDHNINTLRNDLNGVNVAINQEIDNNSKREALIKTLQSKLTMLGSLNQEQKEIEESPLNTASLIDVSSLQQYAGRLSVDVNRVIRARDLTPRRDDYTTLSTRIQELMKMMEIGSVVLSTVNAFKYIAVEAAMLRLSQFCNQVLEHIFNESIMMKITTVKTMKNGIKKNRIHLEIVRCGLSVDYTSLSGGQKERVSLAITLAITMSHPSTVQMILLDEVLSSLNEENRDRCLKLFDRAADHNPLHEMMAPLLNSKMFLFTDHIMSGHYFDQVITIR